jgi:hypothetical protein
MEEDLPRYYTTHDGVVLSIGAISGVRSVTDLAGVSKDTLEALLLKSPPATIKKARRSNGTT